jgi:ABC-2 type transport system permease protein
VTAQSVAAANTTARRPRGGMFLGFTTILRKEITEWFKGPKALIVAGVSIVAAIFTTLIPFIVKATSQPAQAGVEGTPLSLTLDPTANVLLGWGGQTVPLIAVIATMALMSTERDRGTLAWTLTNPVSPTSVIAAKFIAGMLVFGVAAVILPLIVSVGLATVAYGALPDLAIVGAFAGLFLAVPAFYIALTIGLGTAVKTTAGVAGIAFAVMFVPQILGGLLPIITEVSPTSIGTWAMATAKGEPASMLTLAGWLVSMAVIVIASKLVFDRQEL